MAKKKEERWTLDRTEVGGRSSSHSKSGRSKASQSRALDERSKEIVLVHKPTGLEVKGEIPEGNYSRNQMKEHEQQLLEKLYQELEVKVAKKLRIPGYA